MLICRLCSLAARIRSDIGVYEINEFLVFFERTKPTVYYGILFYIMGFIYSVCVFGEISHCIVVNIDIFNLKFSDYLLFHLSLTAFF